MDKIKPMYGTTMNGTDQILSKWLDGDRMGAIDLLKTCIAVNKPETPNNTDVMAEDTIKKYIEDNF